MHFRMFCAVFFHLYSRAASRGASGGSSTCIRTRCGLDKRRKVCMSVCCSCPRRPKPTCRQRRDAPSRLSVPPATRTKGQAGMASVHAWCLAIPCHRLLACRKASPGSPSRSVSSGCGCRASSISANGSLSNAWLARTYRVLLRRAAFSLPVGLRKRTKCQR